MNVSSAVADMSDSLVWTGADILLGATQTRDELDMVAPGDRFNMFVEWCESLGEFARVIKSETTAVEKAAAATALSGMVSAALAGNARQADLEFDKLGAAGSFGD